MSIYNIDFETKAVELLPPDKRYSKFVAWIKALFSQNTYNHTDVYRDYKTGCNDYYPIWDIGNFYALGDRVTFGEVVYECINPEGIIAVDPSNTTDWRVYENFFLGVDERVLFSHQKIVLEYALNKRFHTNFAQPPLISQIYIETFVQDTVVFVVGAEEIESSIVYYDKSSEFVIDAYTFVEFFNFTVYVPLAVYNAVSTDPSARELTFRNFIDRYNTVGLIYKIETY